MADADADAVARFVALTGSTADEAGFMLEATHGDLEQAVQMYYDSHPSAAPVPQQQPAGGPPAPSAAGRGSARQQQQQQQQHAGGGGGLLALPMRLLVSGIRAMAAVVRLTMHIAAAVGDRVLPASIMRSARGLIRSMAALAAEPPDPAAQAAQFVSAFSARYGDVHPAWVASSWRDAAAAAHRQFKFLLVYLHAPEHEDTDAYVRSVLCDAHVASYADAHFVAWGGSIRQPDAFTLSGRLNVSAYPCVALLAFSGSRTKLVAAAQGSMSARALLAMLTRVQDEQSVMLTAERLEQEEREVSRRLLAEQNAEYEASLAADRAREAQRAEERRAAEAAAAEAAAEAARARAEAEAAEQRRLQAATSIAARRQQKRASLPPEPDAAGSSGGGGDVAAIRVRLPDGQNHQRRFAAAESVQVLYDWVDSLEGFDCLRYSLVSAFPKRVFDAAGCGGLSLADAGLAPQGALFVCVHDDDGEDGGGGSGGGGGGGGGDGE